LANPTFVMSTSKYGTGSDSEALVAMRPETWGPPLWTFLHAKADAYPQRATREEA